MGNQDLQNYLLTFALGLALFSCGQQTGSAAFDLAGAQTTGTTSKLTTLTSSSATTSCGQSAVNQSSVDATPVISQCIASAASGSTVALLPGTYTLKTPLIIVSMNNVTLTTQGISPSQITAPCLASGSNLSCAVLQADPSFDSHTTLVQIQWSSGFQVIAVAIDGNHTERLAKINPSTFQRTNSFASNLDVTNAKNARFFGFASVNTLYGTAFDLDLSSNVTVDTSLIANNGIGGTPADFSANAQPKFASDGMTVGTVPNLVVQNSFFIDNSDVDLIFGSCPGAVIQNNRITATYNYSNAAIMLENWSLTDNSGTNFTDVEVKNNVIDCGPQAYCAIGIMVGSDLWSISDYNIFGAIIQDNQISRVKQGIEISGAEQIFVVNNTLSAAGGYSGSGVHTSAIDVDPNHSLNIAVDGNLPVNDYTGGVDAGMLNPSYNTYGGPQYIVAMTASASVEPVIASFTASEASIPTGASTTISWQVSGATSVSITGVGSVSSSGSVVVTPSESTFYTLTAMSSSGTVSQQLPINVATSPQSAQYVQQLFSGFLGRSASSADLIYYQEAMLNGVSCGQIAIDIMTSPEYQSKYAAETGNPQSYVQQLYQGLLGRIAQTNDLSYYVAQLSSQAGVQQLTAIQVASEILSSVEYNNDCVNNYGAPGGSGSFEFADTACNPSSNPLACLIQ